MKNLLVRMTVLVMTALPVSVTADMGGNTDTPVTILDEIVVTATRQEEKVSSVPANVTVIAEEDIRNSTATNVADLLKTQVGVQVSDITGNGRSYSVDLRGFGVTATLNTLVLVDGRKINQPDLSGTDWALISLDRVKRVEIIRGGRGSVLYGDNAAGGVVNIITKEGETFKTGVEVVTGSYETFMGSAYVSGSKKDVSYAFSSRYFNSDGYRNNSGTDAKDVGANVSYYINDQLRINLSSDYHKDKTGLPGPLKKSDFDAGASETDTKSPDDFTNIEDYYIKIMPEIAFLKNSLVKIDASFRRREAQFFSSYSNGTYYGDTTIDTKTISTQLVLREKLSGFTNNLIFGMDYSNASEDIANTSVFFGTETKGRFDLKKTDYGLYLHDEFNLSDKLAISGGYRFDKAEFEFNPSTPDKASLDERLYTMGINYKYHIKSYAYLTYSRSFRYPVLDEIFNFFSNTIDTELTQQTSDNFEVGLKHYFSENLYAVVNLFRIDTEDEIFYNPTRFTNENMDGETRRDGVEIAINKRFKRVKLSGNYTYTKATIRDGRLGGNDVPDVPKHKAALNATLFMGKGFSLALNGTYVGERPFDADFSNAFENQEAYLVLNTKLSYRWKKMKVYMNINNVTNKEYSEFGVAGSFPVEKTYYPSPKTNFLIGISADF